MDDRNQQKDPIVLIDEGVVTSSESVEGPKEKHDDFLHNASSSSSSSSSSTTAPLSSSPPAVELRNVHKTYLLGVEGVAALRGVSLKIEQGEFVVILGKSGGGKTTLLNVLGTIDQPTRGELDLCGVRIDSKTPDSTLANIRLKKIAFVFQAFNLLPGLTALENVELPMLLSATPALPSARTFRAAQLLSRVGMAERLDHTPSQMSGGEQQRVTIARALANQPELLLLDEPTGDLDLHNSLIVMKLLTDLNKSKGVTCVMVTHDIALKAYAHRVVHMLDGRISRVEEIPAFVRDEALEALADTPSVRAWEGVKKAQRNESIKARKETSVDKQDAGAESGRNATEAGKVEEEEEEDAVAIHALLARRQTALAAAYANTLFGRARLATSAAFKHYSSKALDAFFKAFPQFRSNTRYTSEKLDEGEGRESSTAASSSTQSVVVRVSSSEEGVVREPATSTSSVMMTPADPGVPASTGTGLTGVAAISHAMFSQQLSEDAASGPQLPISSSTTVATIPIIHRSPTQYPAYAFGLSMEKTAIADEFARKELLLKREATLRKRVELSRAARLNKT